MRLRPVGTHPPRWVPVGSMAAEDVRSIESLVLEMKGVYVALPSLQPLGSDDWSAAPVSASADDGAAAAELLAHAHGLARQIEALRRGPPQPLLRRENSLLVLEALISGEILEGLEALERATGAAPATVYCGFVDTAHRIIYDAVAEDRLSAATKMASCLTGVDDVAAYFRDMLRNTSRPVMRSRLLQILHAADRDGAAGAAHGYGDLLELRALALEVQLTPPEESMRLLAPSVRLALALDHFYSVESFGVEFNSKSTALIMSQLVSQRSCGGSGEEVSPRSLDCAGAIGPRGWRVTLASDVGRHVLEDRTAELDDIGPIDWARVAPNDMRSDIASGVSVSESRHPNAATIDRHAPSERSRQMFDPLSFSSPGVRAELRAYGHFRLLWLEEWSEVTQVRVLAEVQHLLPQEERQSDPWLHALASGDSTGKQQLKQERAQLQVLVDRHDVEGAVNLVRAILSQTGGQASAQAAVVEMVNDVVQGSGGESRRQCAVLLREALANELAAAALFLPTEREPALMVRRLARSGLLFETPVEPEPESQLRPTSESLREHCDDTEPGTMSQSTDAAVAAQTVSLVLGFLAKHRAYAAISAFLRCRYPQSIPTEQVQAFLDAAGASNIAEADPWVCFILGSLSEKPADVFRACCENGRALLPSLTNGQEKGQNSGAATVQAMLKAGEPLMALGVLLFSPIPLQSITTEAGSTEPASRVDLQLLSKALAEHGVDIARFLSHLEWQASENIDGGGVDLGSTAGLAKAASAVIARKHNTSDGSSDEAQQIEQTEMTNRDDFVQVFGAPASDLGFADEVGSVFYLQQERPAAAAEWHCRHHGCLTPLAARQQRGDEATGDQIRDGSSDSSALAVVATARAVALQNYTSLDRTEEDASKAASGIISACVQFCQLFGLDAEAQVLKADAAAINVVRSHLLRVRSNARSVGEDETATASSAGRSSSMDASGDLAASTHRQPSMENACKTFGPQADIDVRLVLECLEEVATSQATNTSSNVQSDSTEHIAWDVLRAFCETHKDEVLMSPARARWLASSSQWIELLCEAQLSNLSVETMLQVVAAHCKPGMREHLTLFLRTQQAQEAEKSKEIQSAAEAHLQHAMDNAGHVYDELCGTLLECTRRTDPAAAMLEAAVETSRPILALISHSGFAAPTTKSMLAFVCARLPELSSDLRGRNIFRVQSDEVTQQQNDAAVDLLQNVLCEAVRLQRAAVAAEAFVSFCPEHPLHSLFSFARNCMQRRYQHAQTDLNDFIDKSALGGNVAWTQSGLGAASTCKIARAVVTCLYQISTGVEKTRLAQVAGSAGPAGFSPQFFRRRLIVNLLPRLGVHPQPQAQAVTAEGCDNNDPASSFATADIVDLLPKELVRLLTRRRRYAEAHEFATACSLYAARQRLAFGFGIRSMLGQHQYPPSLWPRLRSARIDLATGALQLAAEAIASDIVAQYDIALAQVSQMVADFRTFGTDGTQAGSRRAEPAATGTGLWDRCHDILVEGGVPPPMIAEFFLVEAERPQTRTPATASGAVADRAERVELLSWVRTVLDTSAKSKSPSKADTEWKDSAMRRIFAVMDMDDNDDNDEQACGQFEDSSPALVMVRRHKTTDNTAVAETLAAKIKAAAGGHRGGSFAGTVDGYGWDEWENDVLDLEEPTAVAEALLAQVETQPTTVSVSAASSAPSMPGMARQSTQHNGTVTLAIERDILLLAHCCAVAGNELQCIHRVLDVLQARCKVYARFGHVKLVEQAALLLAGSGGDEHSTAYVEPILEIFLYHDNDGHGLLQSLIDTIAPYATAVFEQEQKQQRASAISDGESEAETRAKDRPLCRDALGRERQHQQRALQTALMQSMKQRPQQFSAEITVLHRRLLPAQRREFALFLQQRSDAKVRELVRARRLHSADAELQAEMSRTASAAQRLYGEAAKLYAEEGCYRQQRRCSCLSSLLDIQQQNPDLELLELDKGPAAAAQALRSSSGRLRSLGDVATYQLLAVAHGFERQLDEAWPDLVYEHSVLGGSLPFFSEFLRRVCATAVFYEQLARRHYLAATTERRSADEDSFVRFASKLKEAGLLEAYSKLLAAAEAAQRLLQL